MESKAAVNMLSALGHEGRLAIFRLLVQAGPAGVAAGEIARALNVLSHAGLIASRRDGRSIIYTADYDAMSGLLGFLMEDCCAGAPQICAPLSAIVSGGMACGAGKA